MAKVIFGVWDNQIIDNRKKRFFELEEVPGLEDFFDFEPGNPIKAFLGSKGFFIFEKGVNLLDSALKHIEKAAKESCGKCTPCRVGTQILKKRLADLTSGNTPATEYNKILDEILSLSTHIKNTSLCGLGQTSTEVLICMLSNFRTEIESQLYGEISTKRHPATTYVTSPCIEACPSKVDVPRYIDYIKDGKIANSIGVVLQKYPMAATCGRVCVRFCEMACRRTMVDEAVGIKILKRFVADHEKYVTDHWFTPELIEEKKSPDLKVAVIGTGPAGISAAYQLLLDGYTVDVFEAMTHPGGMAAVGIPEYRLPKEVLRKEVSIIESLGGKIYYNERMGLSFTLSDLISRGYKAVFLGLGAHKGKTLGIPGEEKSLKGYISGVKFLLYINYYYIDIGIPMDLGQKIVVVGGGNVAMDCARSALRMGGVKEVHVIYRRSKNEMPADHEEIDAAEKEGIIFHFQTHPTKIITEDRIVKGIELIKMELTAPDADGRRTVRPVEGSQFVIDTDFVIPAIGQEVDLSFLSKDDGINIDKWGLITVDQNTLMTDKRGVFAGGDCVTGPATLIEAMAQGSKAASSINDYLSHGRIKFNPEARMSQLLSSIRKIDYQEVHVPVKNEYRVQVKELDPVERKKLFEEVEKPISMEEAYKEANRCMRCYRVYSVITEK